MKLNNNFAKWLTDFKIIFINVQQAIQSEYLANNKNEINVFSTTRNIHTK